MVEFLDAIASWSSLFLVVVVFGFAPGFCLRLIVLSYARGNPRRAELIAELYAVPRIQRPLWVAEQLEVALFEGLVPRILALIRLRWSPAESRRLLAQEVSHLSDWDRAVFTLYYLENLTFAEIGQTLGVQESRVRHGCTRMILRLRSRMLMRGYLFVKLPDQGSRTPGSR